MTRCAALLMISFVICGCTASVRYTPDFSPATRDTTSETGVETIAPEDTGVDNIRLDSIARSYLGVPYRSGGYGRLGVDCSGLVYTVYRDYADLHLSPSSKDLFNDLPRADDRDLRTGDLVFFSLNGRYASHVGIYVGEGSFVHASQSNGVVLSDLTEDYFRMAYIGARRVVR